VKVIRPTGGITLTATVEQTQKFGRVSGNQVLIRPTTNGIKVNVDIKQVNAVSDVARVMVGAFAGQARILVQVRLSDLARDEPHARSVGIFAQDTKKVVGMAL